MFSPFSGPHSMTPTTFAPRDTILIVDDSADTVAMLADLLEGAGFNALVALRGERAISIARQVTPDLVLMDAVMPGLDGFETCRQMKRDEGLARLPVIFMTGLAETDHIVRALAVGGSDYVGKPVDATALLAATPGFDELTCAPVLVRRVASMAEGSLSGAREATLASILYHAGLQDEALKV